MTMAKVKGKWKFLEDSEAPLLKWKATGDYKGIKGFYSPVSISFENDSIISYVIIQDNNKNGAIDPFPADNRIGNWARKVDYRTFNLGFEADKLFWTANLDKDKFKIFYKLDGEKTLLGAGPIDSSVFI